MGEQQHLVLLYDGLCAFCNGLVRFVLKQDPGGSLRFAALQSDFAKEILARHPEVGGVDTAALVEPASGAQPERVSLQSAAVLRLSRYLGWPWAGLMVLTVIPRFIRDWGYNAFALVRYRVFGKYQSCPLPSADERARFIL